MDCTGDLNSAVRIFKWASRCPGAEEALMALVNTFFAANQIELALDQFRRMENKGYNPNSKTFEILVKGLIESGRVNEAATVITAVHKENKVEEAVKLFKMMKDSDFVPDSFICKVLVWCFCNNLRLDSAVGLINEMIESGMPPKHDVLVDMMNCSCELGKINEAIMFLEDTQVHETAPFNTLLEGCCNAVSGLSDIKHSQDAIEVFHYMSMKRCSLHSLSFYKLIKCVCDSGQVNEGLIPDPDRLFDQLSFITNHSQLSMISSAIDRISDGDILNPAMFGFLITVLLKEGKEHEARQLLDSMLEKGWLPDATTHYLLIGSDVRERSKTMLFDNSASLDSVSNIPAEGLGDTWNFSILLKMTFRYSTSMVLSRALLAERDGKIAGKLLTVGC
ncbi:hypothetical protein JHK85_028830 [Glycine max]|nr:hypothetical protein JHK85_028830 [Glycine max]KHN16024.1 Pentatricopeptide repeat-containing protein, chloroplastic [Glycine soja]